MNTGNSKTNEPHKFVLNLSHWSELRSSNDAVTLQNLSPFYMKKNIWKQSENNKLKLITPTWNNEFDLSFGSYSFSDIQDYIEYINNPFQDGHFPGCSWMGGGAKKGPKICYIYTKIMKLGTVILYLKKIRKNYESRDTAPDFSWNQQFFIGNQQILLYQEIQV